MILQVVSVHDSAVDAFGRPIFVAAIGAATRSFADEVNNPQSEMNKHPADYTLFHLGTFDDASGTFSQSAPKQLARASDVHIPKG